MIMRSLSGLTNTEKEKQFGVFGRDFPRENVDFFGQKGIHRQGLNPPKKGKKERSCTHSVRLKT